LRSGDHPQKVQVQKSRFERVALDIAQHGLLGAIAQIQGQHMRVDRLVLELIHQIQLIQQQWHRILPAAIQNGRHLAGAA
jgi:hypothetical protein